MYAQHVLFRARMFKAPASSRHTSENCVQSMREKLFGELNLNLLSPRYVGVLIKALVAVAHFSSHAK